MSTVPTELQAAANATSGTESASTRDIPAWKRDLNDKVAAARARRHAGQQGSSANDQAAQGEVIQSEQTESRAARVAAAVAARYAQAPSYGELLAAEVQTARLAAAAAQISANAALAAAEAAAKQVCTLQAALRADIEAGHEASREASPEAIRETRTDPQARSNAAERNLQAPAAPSSGTPRVDYAATGVPYHPAVAARALSTPLTQDPTLRPVQNPSAASPYRALTPRIADPLSEEMLSPAVPLPANLLEFPRELFAARKARPRHAEGPLREEGQEEPPLRIFEVEADAVFQPK